MLRTDGYDHVKFIIRVERAFAKHAPWDALTRTELGAKGHHFIRAHGNPFGDEKFYVVQRE